MRIRSPRFCTRPTPSIHHHDLSAGMTVPVRPHAGLPNRAGRRLAVDRDVGDRLLRIDAGRLDRRHRLPWTGRRAGRLRRGARLRLHVTRGVAGGSRNEDQGEQQKNGQQDSTCRASSHRHGPPHGPAKAGHYVRGILKRFVTPGAPVSRHALTRGAPRRIAPRGSRDLLSTGGRDRDSPARVRASPPYTPLPGCESRS